MTFLVEKIPERGISVLKLSGDLTFDTRTAFHNAIAQLRQTDSPKLVVDLSAVDSLSSMYIGSLIDLATKLNQENKTLGVVLKKRLAGICEKVGLPKVAQVVTV